MNGCSFLIEMERLNPMKLHDYPAKTRSACASAQSDQSLSLNGTLIVAKGPKDIASDSKDSDQPA